jgi:hypothetical protein
MAKKKISFGSSGVLQLVVGIALFFIGLLTIINYNSTGREVQRFLTDTFGGKSDVLDLIFGILLLVSGVFVAGALFLPLDNKLLSVMTLIAFVVWAIRIVLIYFVNDIFEPDFVNWIAPFCVDLIVLIALWTVNRKYA